MMPTTRRAPTISRMTPHIGIPWLVVVGGTTTGDDDPLLLSDDNGLGVLRIMDGTSVKEGKPVVVIIGFPVVPKKGLLVDKGAEVGTDGGEVGGEVLVMQEFTSDIVSRLTFLSVSVTEMTLEQMLEHWRRSERKTVGTMILF